MEDELKLTDAPVTPEAPSANVAVPLTGATPDNLTVEVAQLRADKAKLEAELTKRDNDWKAVRGTLRKDLKTQAETELLRQDVAAINDTLAAVLTEFSNDPDIPQKLADIKTRHQTQAEEYRKTTQGHAQAIFEEIGKQVAVAHKVNFRTDTKKVQEILQTDPQWAAVWELTLDAWNGQSIAGLNAALEHAEGVRETLQEKRLTDAIEKARVEARKEADKETRERLKESGALGMPWGAAAGGGGPGIDMKSILATGTIPRNATPQQLVQINAALDAHLRRKRP